MKPTTTRSLFWLPGPLLAFALVTLAIVGRGGPGFFFMSLVGGVLFLFGAPILQLVLLSTSRYRGRYKAACGVALLTMFALLCVPVLAGVFNFY